MKEKVRIIAPAVRKSGEVGKKRVCAYCRVSTSNSQQIGSYESQLEYYENLIRSNADWEFAGIYADYAQSGTKKSGRTEFQRMLEDCEAGEIDAICTKSISRFARNTVDCIRVVRELRKRSIDVYFEKERIHTLSEKSEILLSIYSSVAQAESESISTNQKWGVQKRFLDGSFILSNPAYGYYNNEQGLLELDPQRAAVVRFIFDEYLDGKGTWLIAKSLNEQHIPTKTGKKNWIPVTVYGILRNQVYTGDLLLQKSYSEDVVPFRRRKNHGEYQQVLIENDHEPIITHDEYKIVQRMLAQKSKSRKKRENQADSFREKHPYKPDEGAEFRGKIVCGVCGAAYNRQAKRDRSRKINVMWTCAERIKSKDFCGNDIVKESRIKQAFFDLWNKLSAHCGEILVPLANELEQLQTTPLLRDRLEILDKQTQEQKKQREILSRLASGEKIDSAFYMQQLGAIEQRLHECQHSRKQCLQKFGQRKELAQTKALIKLLQNESRFLETYDAALFHAVVERVVIHPSGEMVFRLKNGLELTEKAKKFEGGQL